MSPAVTRRPGRATSPILVGVAVLSALVLFAAMAVAMPGRALGATNLAAACDANLRTSASTGATRKATIATNTKVTAVSSVTGGSWRAECAGKVVSGSKWYRISAVNGRSVKSLYGVTYVYAASGVLKASTAATRTIYASCNDVNLRTAPGTSWPRKVQIDTGTSVSVVAVVDGNPYEAVCADRTLAGRQWYRISAIGGKSVKSLYGISYLYAASRLFAADPPTGSSLPPATTSVTEGIDVSHWQGTIDWAKVRAAGKRFVFIKSSEDDDFVDSKYASNRAGAKAAGLLVGAYHFAQPGSGSGDAVAEADHFVATAKAVKGELLPVLDLEVTNGLGPTALQSWTRTFLTRVYERTGVRAVIYVSPAFWRNSMADTSWFAANGYKVLWTAHWTTASSPSSPAGNWGGHGWTFWQYSSTGTVAGISGRVDLNRYRGTDFRPVLIP
jgi:GH25 family lysozyme M1 (1,4-beta-N-acetylmuramidase)